MADSAILIPIIEKETGKQYVTPKCGKLRNQSFYRSFVEPSGGKYYPFERKNNFNYRA